MKLSEAAEKRAEELKAKYPDVKSAVMPILYIAQEEIGHINNEAVLWVAEKVGMSPIHVRELVTFYTMYYSKPVGTYHFQVCRTLSCALNGAKSLTEKLAKKFDLKPGEVSPCGKWSYEEVECLGSCGTAPVCEINDVYFEKLTPEKLEEIIEKIEAEEPALRFSTVEDQLGTGLSEHPRSQLVNREEQ